MISREIIENILTAGCAAPSGSNSQPWEFEVTGNIIKVISKPEKDHPVLNVYYRGTWIAHGALIENICIMASTYGIIPIVNTFSEKNDEFVTSTITLNENASTKPDELAPAIFKRTTNRKPYLQKPIPEDILNHLENALRLPTVVKVNYISNKETIKKIATTMSTSDKVMFGNKILHNLFFNEVAWNKDHEEKKGGGLLLDTLELKVPQRTMLHLLKYWPIMKIAAGLGIAKQIAKENAVVHSSCGLLCVVQVPKDKDSFLEAGRQIQRIWLTATKDGLSVQLNTGLFFFWQGIESNSAVSVFSDAEKREIKTAYDSIASIFSIKDNIVTAILRVGYGGEPSAKSTKLPPVIKWIS
jgi:hypothetical protein